MMCPNCDREKTYIVDSVEIEYETRRRRRCPSCGYRFTTYERLAQTGILKERNRRETDGK